VGSLYPKPESGSISLVSVARRWPLAAVFLFYSAVTFVMAYPFSARIADGVISVGTDTDLYIWTLAWDTYAILHQPFAIFDANIFFPFKHTLAYSENLLGSVIFAAPLLWLTNNPMVTMNVVSLLSIPLSGLGACVLARRLNVSMAAAILCGLMWAFTPPRFLRLDQVHLTTIQWIPFTLAYLHAYVESGRARDLRLALMFFSLQALTSGHGAAMTVLAIGLMAIYRLASGEPLALAKRVRDVGVVGVLLLVPVVLTYLPYRAAQVEVGLRRTLDNWAIPWSSFFSSPSQVQSFVLSFMPQWDWMKVPPEAWLFPGILPLGLAIAAFWKRSDRTWHTPFYLLMAVVCVWFAIGPPFGVWRWVYWMPGLSFIRVPSRFLLLGLLAVAVLAAMGFERITRRWPTRRNWIAVAAGAALLAEFSVVPFSFREYSIEIPAIDRFLTQLRKPFSVIELPVPDSLSLITQERRNTLYMLHSMAHFQPIVQGYSGLQPPGYMERHWEFSKFPDEKSLATLAEMGVTHAVLHVDLIPPSERAESEARFERFKDRLHLVRADGDGRLYQLLPARR